MKYLKHEIVSDPLYAGRKQLKNDLQWCPRMFLQAKFLSFVHPKTGKRCEFEVPLAEGLEEVRKKLASNTGSNLL